MTDHHLDEFERIYRDAATPPQDRYDLERFLREVDESYDPRAYLAQPSAAPGLLELEYAAPSSGHRYGVLFIDVVHVADAVAYWREPPLYVDRRSSVAHGMSRSHALLLAARRLEATR